MLFNHTIVVYGVIVFYFYSHFHYTCLEVFVLVDMNCECVCSPLTYVEAIISIKHRWQYVHIYLMRKGLFQSVLMHVVNKESARMIHFSGNVRSLHQPSDPPKEQRGIWKCFSDL